MELAENFPGVWATVGLHPGDVDHIADDAVEHLRLLAQSRRVVAIGEIGLDYRRLPENPFEAQANKERQARFFRQQLDLTVELGLNAVIHQRDSWDDTLAILREYAGKVRGVYHCFGGTPEQVSELVAMGHLVSFTGIVTFKNAGTALESARSAATGTFMVETDCPYLAPVPHRGKRCEPSHTRRIAEHLAEVRGVTLEAFAAETTQTARAFFAFNR